MDESWRMRMGMATKPNLPRRKSTEETSRRNVFGDNHEILDPKDFDDVFGGPPRSVLSRHFSGNGGKFVRSTLLYEDIFGEPNNMAADWRGRSLPEFRIPASGGGRRKEEEFYGDIFGDDLRRSRSRSQSKTNSKSKSKSNSSSVLSSEDLSPFRPAIIDDDDVSFSAFASKLRPINVSSKSKSSAMMHKVQSRKEGTPDFPSSRPSYIEKQFAESEYHENFRSSRSACSQRVSSPEIISLEPNSYGSFKVSVDDLQLNSPSSMVSSLCHDQEVEASIMQDKALQGQSMELEEDEVMSSYVIEINPENRQETSEELDIDEAIAWAKEKCQTCSPQKEWSMGDHNKEQSVGVEERSSPSQFLEGEIRGCESTQSPLEPKEQATEEEIHQLKRDMELEMLDEDLRLWSAGKEVNIRLLLSTLHHILWPSSGWKSLPLANLKESSHVKKAYQKARLCLHPDKLQQRGATIPQKYVAEKAFPILQDAWATFISQECVFNASG